LSISSKNFRRNNCKSITEERDIILEKKTHDNVVLLTFKEHH